MRSIIFEIRNTIQKQDKEKSRNKLYQSTFIQALDLVVADTETFNHRSNRFNRTASIYCCPAVEMRGEELDAPVVVDGTVVADSVSEGVLARSPLSTRSDSSAKSSTSVGTAVGVQQEPQRSPSSKC